MTQELLRFPVKKSAACYILKHPFQTVFEMMIATNARIAGKERKFLQRTRAHEQFEIHAHESDARHRGNASYFPRMERS